MASAGELLREERIKRNLTVREIADSTRISTRYLEALEANDLAALPGNFFYRAFLKQYATALNLDSDATKRVLDSAAPAPERDPIPAMTAAYQVAQIDSRSSGERRTGTTGAIMLLVAVLVACSAMYAIWHADTASEAAEKSVPAVPAKPLSEPATPSPSTQVANGSEQPSLDGASAPPDPGGVQPGSAEPPPAQSTTPDPSSQEGGTTPARTQALVPAGSTTVELAAKERTWVSLSSDGKILFAGVLDVSRTRSFNIGANAKLFAGNAGGVDVRFNGKPIGPIGPRGQVRIVTFSATDFQIVTPPRKTGA